MYVYNRGHIAFNFWSDAAGTTTSSKSNCPYNMTVQNVYNVSNYGTMFFPGAAQGTQCGDYNNMYMSLLHDAGRNVGSEADANERRDSADSAYEHLEADIEVVSLWG